MSAVTALTALINNTYCQNPMTGFHLTESDLSSSGICPLVQSYVIVLPIRSNKTLFSPTAAPDCCHTVRLTCLRGHQLILSANCISGKPAKVSIKRPQPAQAFGFPLLIDLPFRNGLVIHFKCQYAATVVKDENRKSNRVCRWWPGSKLLWVSRCGLLFSCITVIPTNREV